MIALLIMGWVYRKFVAPLPGPTRRGLLLGAGLIVAGGLGVESVGGWYLPTQGDDYGYELIGGTEEVLELKGAATLLGTFLAHIGRSIGDVRLSFRPT